MAGGRGWGQHAALGGALFIRAASRSAPRLSETKGHGPRPELITLGLACNTPRRRPWNSPAAVVPAHLSPLSDLPEASDLMLSRTADGLMMLTRLSRKKKLLFFWGPKWVLGGRPLGGGRGLYLSVLIGGSEICPLGVFS